MNASDLVKQLSLEHSFSDEQAKAVLDSIVRIISDTLQSDEVVLISGFGKFEVRDRKAILLKNPKTGQPIEVPPKKTVKFNPSPMLRDRISQ